MLSGVYRNTLLDRVVYGRPAPDVLAELLEAYGKRRALVVSTRSLSGPRGLGTGIAEGLGERCVGLFGRISAHSPRDDVIAAAEEARRLQADILVAVGGGSVIDACKVVQLALWNGLADAAALDPFAGRGPRRREDAAPGVDPLRMIAIPTTLSAAEFTPFAGVTDTRHHAKEGYAHPLLRAARGDPRSRDDPPDAAGAVVLHRHEGGRPRGGDSSAARPARRSPTRWPSEGLKGLAAGLRASKAAPDDPDARLKCQLGMWLAISGGGGRPGAGRQPRHRPHAGRHAGRAARAHLVRRAAGGAGLEHRRQSRRRAPGRRS